VDGAILLAVADPTVRRHLLSLVAERGYACRQAASLAECARTLQSTRHPVAILDLDLLGDDPLHSAQTLLAKAPDIRLIGLDSVAERRADLDASPLFHAVIPKPFLAERLLGVLAQIVTPHGSTAAD